MRPKVPMMAFVAAWFGAMAAMLILKGATGSVVTPLTVLNVAVSTAIGVGLVALVVALRSRD